ncbi:phage baseplate assembly protein V [Azotobacter chroococcum]|uniref:Phage baseplate assembly V family protein n=1 Tax=Azotobacter chroococcum NCIMB 8003 TaxID=1328314 RepID=A0A0C4WPL1_9GAMM|nr:phage baseplate assembly protein V [Azotobacter chroococcum]AJE21500.1 Phage baseplate assembly V family protein [Azotobacter chroococcum NCIMB 8003]
MQQQIRTLGNRVMMAFARGVLRAVSDSTARQTLQVELLRGELRDGVERMQNYGFTAHPHPGADAAIAFVAGNREQGIALVVDDRRYRLKLQPGEVAMYDDLGNKIQLLRDRVQITAVQALEIVTPNVTIAGNVAITGTLTNNGKDVGSTHTHPGDSGGTTGAPN